MRVRGIIGGELPCGLLKVGKLPCLFFFSVRSGSEKCHVYFICVVEGVLGGRTAIWCFLEWGIAMSVFFLSVISRSEKCHVFF